ncbi:hypothetical protein FRC07_000702, partial [Ceratobasidium sp. 392]
MSSNFTTRNLKRRAESSDDGDTPVKQARTNIQNTHARRLPPLRRSDTQTLDVNASTPILQHLPPNVESVPVPAISISQHRGDEQDAGGSTDEESQDEAGAWDRRAKAHRHAALFKRPREPAPRAKARQPKTATEVALLEGSDSDSDAEDIKLVSTSNGVATRLQRLAALRAERAAAGKAVSGPKSRATTFAVPKLPARLTGTPSVASSSTSTTTTMTTTTRSVSRAASRTTVTTTTTVAQRVQEIDELTSSCPTRAPRARAPKLMPAPRPTLPRPQRQNSQARQNAINAIAGSSSSSASTSAPVVERLSTTAPLASQPSAVLRRSKRIINRLAAPEM